ncbi:glutathione S-transferase [Caulobacter sp. 17J80-11]|uniref:glutathione S-transferase n=1 Tax=Caulobacter sp. 17J80-11 TaxID=2763502 RepID=UPI00165360D2|nr:glutathione S-transferase [Caulobacter sp. 17J80-11]MBC6981830.1 glutathione S-transferase [Caulobacter sp. 17J80-11]
MAYELYYWPTIQGRGEFVRLALEDAGAPYVDVARERGVRPMMELMTGRTVAHPSFAPPFLKDGDVVIGQTANILLYLGGRLGLAPAGETDRLWAHQIQLTVADLVVEAHDVHHPLGAGLYYEDQKAEAARRAGEFRDARIPKFLGWFERILTQNAAGDGWLVGETLTYPDLSLFQVVEGLTYAFPKAAGRALATTPKVVAVHERVKARPRIAAYLASDRRLAPNEEDIFRNYPELDA